MERETIDDDVRVELYRHFAERGHPPVPAEVARTLNVSPHEVETSFRRLADDHVIVLAPGTPYVWMANPFSALPTPFQVDAGGKRWWGNCIWDSLGILASLRQDGGVRSFCPDCGDELTLEVRDGEISKSDYVIHFAVPAAHWWDDIGFN